MYLFVDKIVLLKHNASIIEAVKDSIATEWQSGIQTQKSEVSCGEDLEEIKLNGYPWASNCDETTEARKLLAAIIRNMQKIGWKLHAAVNIKGGTDSLFFIQSTPEVRIKLKGNY